MDIGEPPVMVVVNPDWHDCLIGDNFTKSPWIAETVARPVCGQRTVWVAWYEAVTSGCLTGIWRLNGQEQDIHLNAILFYGFKMIGKKNGLRLGQAALNYLREEMPTVQQQLKLARQTEAEDDDNEN